jgi:hypothetical protein
VIENREAVFTERDSDGLACGKKHHAADSKSQYSTTIAILCLETGGEGTGAPDRNRQRLGEFGGVGARIRGDRATHSHFSRNRWTMKPLSYRVLDRGLRDLAQ